MREFTRAGVAGVQLEDQAMPRRCGHFRGKTVITQSGWFRRSELPATVLSMTTCADCAHRRDCPLRLEDALERAQSYGEAGADLIFVEAPRDSGTAGVAPKRVGFPWLLIWLRRQSPCERSELEEMGYRMVLFANATLKSAVKGCSAFWQDLGSMDQRRGWQLT